jgi:hypothetical protein
MLRTSVLLFVMLAFPSICLAQTGIVTEPDSLLLRESQDILVRNISEELVRIDSLQFSQHSFSGWTLATGTVEDPLRWTPEGLYYALGSLYLWQTFPVVELAPGDTALIRLGHLDRCIVCKAGGIGEYVEIDTLLIFTDIGGADPHAVILNFEHFMVNIEEEPPALPVSLDIYPVPASGMANVSIRLEKPASVGVRVLDVLGREMARPINAGEPAMQHHASIDTSGWASGLYLVRVETSVSGAAPSILTRSFVVVR